MFFLAFSRCTTFLSLCFHFVDLHFHALSHTRFFYLSLDISYIVPNILYQISLWIYFSSSLLLHTQFATVRCCEMCLSSGHVHGAQIF